MKLRTVAMIGVIIGLTLGNLIVQMYFPPHLWNEAIHRSFFQALAVFAYWLILKLHENDNG